MITGLLAGALQMSTPLMMGALAEVYAERTGVMIIAIEGIFLLGAWGGFVAAYSTGSMMLGLLAAMAIGTATALVYGIFTVKLKQHQIVTGTAINIFAAGLGIFLYRVFFGVPLLPLTVDPLERIAVPGLSSIPVIGEALFHQNALTYLAWALIPVGYWILYKTQLGLILRSTGENPEAVDAAGIKVETVRLGAVLAAGALDGLAGAFYSLGFLGMYTNDIIGGRGWIAFAICFLGNWNPMGVLVGALVFGLADAMAIQLQTSGVTLIPNEFLIAMPYILTIVATVARKRFNVPATLGVPYEKERR
ncbi:MULTISPECIES: ABC transporter permease [Dethiosulfovibrio]|uniref:ABC transporter permease n=2 Tax=Dethiosulfovibrio TaxID=47054 RepID=A0ABS9EMT2_9BACT|nr:MULTISPECIES: ABC transporter permease [Dethiosulfovibrio]MCF4113366.1 ABC transporter permease [Dethiosulfovibrio russensis]MCF4142497.1 ABC transporter permease [Dethiosulfovibrio marinus]MCF4145785.1 ABC transporter permease [Dethiosulfovibrio acidaminovorans]